MEIYKYFVIIEKAEDNYSSYCPDLPGCVATGETVDKTVQNMKEAIEFHIEGLKKDGLQISQSSIEIRSIEIAA